MPQILTVTDLTSQVRTALEQEFPALWVEGEVSNLRCPSSGHLYFTLKDQKSQIRAVLFRGASQRLRFSIEDGLEVLVYGRLTVYAPRGDYQLILETLEPKGVGALQLAYEQLKKVLGQEGLFDPDRKRELPFLPRTIGIVTSETGAAIQDMLTILRRRCPLVHIVIHPVSVQGEGAAVQIVDAIQTLNTLGTVDVLIVGRGGGSVEDLWCFNEEIVVRAIAGSTIPVISAVGHEVDFTLSDFAADYRAPTPSAAAEVVVPRLEDLLVQVANYQTRQGRAMQNTIEIFRHNVQSIRQSIPDPIVWVAQYAQRVDDLEMKLHQSLRDMYSRYRFRLLALHSSILMTSPQQWVHRSRVVVPQLFQRMVQGLLATVQAKRHRWEMHVTSLHTLSPMAILSRGYSIVETLTENTVLRRAKDVSVGHRVRAKLAEGQLICLVQETKGDQ